MEIGSLEPQAVWRHFADIMAIPHISYHEGALKEHVKRFAESLNIEAVEDRAGNLILRKGATEGMSDRKGVILQGHLDMVPQRGATKVFDFLSDPIEGYVDGEWVRANDTTLGADNGLGLAAAMALLEDKELKHGEIEVLMTLSEEVGMDGAFGLEEGILQGDILLNLDTEVEGELCIGCAGGLDLIATFEYEMEATPESGYVARRLSVSGLRGGHSGIEINEQRGNANKLLFRLLRLSKLDILLCGVDGGSLRNAIPRDAAADILIATSELEDFERQVAKYESTINEEYAAADGAISVTLTEIEQPVEMIDPSAASCIVWAIAGCQDGVYRYSKEMAGLVQSSSNLAIVKSESGRTKVELLLRSSSESEKSSLADSIASIFELADAEVICEGGYPGWQPNLESPILREMVASYRELFGREVEVRAVHAGLECGVIGATYPKFDMISFGPTILSPHSPAERANIASVEKFYRLLRHTVENIPSRE